MIKVLSVFADDASDAKSERIFVVAGVMGTQEEWDNLETKWLARTSGQIFHATDCESDRGDFKNIPHEQNKKLYKDLTKLLAETPMMGFGSAIDINAYRTFMEGALEDAPYFHCFVRVILYFVKWTRVIIPQQKVKFTFDINPKTRFNAAFLYDNLLCRRREYTQYTQYMDKDLSFATRETVGIQVADLFTYEVMKHFDNQFGPVKRRTRLSLETLLKTHRFVPHYYTREYFEAFAKNIKDIESRSGVSSEKYIEWLKEHNCLDNAENRTRYAIYLESVNPEPLNVSYP